MNELIGTRRRARKLCAILLLQLVASCSSWHRLPGVGLAHPESERLGRAKVFLHDGTELDLENASIRPDSIIGFGGDMRARLAVARSEVTRVETRQPNGPATFLVGGLVPVALAFLAVAAAIAAYIHCGCD